MILTLNMGGGVSEAWETLAIPGVWSCVEAGAETGTWVPGDVMGVVQSC